MTAIRLNAEIYRTMGVIAEGNLFNRIFDTEIHVEILTAYGHYGDK